jgi:hypothetical protein
MVRNRTSFSLPTISFAVVSADVGLPTCVGVVPSVVRLWLNRRAVVIG